MGTHKLKGGIVKKIILFCFILSAISLSCYGQATKKSIIDPSATRIPNCVMYLKFDEGANSPTYDNSGNGNNGIFPSSVSARPTWHTGDNSCVFGSALEFDGSDDYLDVPTLAHYPNGKGCISYGCWVKFYSSSEHQIIGWWYNQNNKIFTSFNKIIFEVQAGTRQSIGSNTTLNDGLWHSVIGTYDKNVSADNVRLYIDGVLQIMTKTDTGNISASADPFGIGAFGNGTGKFFKGAIDNVRIYSRALTPREIKAIYQLEKRGKLK